MKKGLLLIMVFGITLINAQEPSLTQKVLSLFCCGRARARSHYETSQFIEDVQSRQAGTIHVVVDNKFLDIQCIGTKVLHRFPQSDIHIYYIDKKQILNDVLRELSNSKMFYTQNDTPGDDIANDFLQAHEVKKASNGQYVSETLDIADMYKQKFTFLNKLLISVKEAWNKQYPNNRWKLSIFGAKTTCMWSLSKQKVNKSNILDLTRRGVSSKR